MARLFLWAVRSVTRETDPGEHDSEEDGIQDGTELGYASNDIGSDTDIGIFQPDLDPTTTTNPLDGDTDNDGWLDGQEDKNCNGRVDAGEKDPNRYDAKVLPYFLLLLLDNE